MPEEEKDPVIKIIEETIEQAGGSRKAWFHSEVVEIVKYRRQVKREPIEPDTTTLLEKLAEKAAKDTARQECIRTKIDYFKARRKMYQTAQRPEMANACEIVTAVLESILPETNPNVEQNEKALIDYLEKETALTIERTC